jgi:septal ring factor EnvC (AmiA/AmiB activator)
VGFGELLVKHEMAKTKLQMDDMKREMAKTTLHVADSKREIGDMKRDIDDMKREIGDMKREIGAFGGQKCGPSPVKQGFWAENEFSSPQRGVSSRRCRFRTLTG